MTAQKILSRLRGVKPAGKGKWKALCPAHDDHNPSLDITEADDGRTLLICRSQKCSTKAICAALNIKEKDLFHSKESTSKIAATYDYWDPVGNLLYQVVRLDPKGFRQRRPDPVGKDGWTWNTKGVQKVLFQLPEVLAAIQKSDPVYVVEGEKDALALVDKGLCATTNPGGAGKWLDSYSETLRGADIIILPDKDPPGRAHGKLVASKLHGVAKRIRVLELPDLDGKPVKDPHDYFAAGGDPADLWELVEATPFWHPAAESNSDPGVDNELIAAPVARRLSELIRHPENDPDELLKYRYLCRGGGLLIAGPAGIGKSSLAMQFQILWALGREAFGIRPARPLKSLVIQAENDDGDLAEMRDGVIGGLELSQIDARRATENIFIYREDGKTGIRFFSETVQPLLEAYYPDLAWLDPSLAYLNGDTKEQKDVGAFLRNWLNPLLRKYTCGGALLHHTNKPQSGKEKAAWKAGDFAYLGSGSAEWANWPRAVLGLRSIGSHNVFELIAPKRGGRLGWKDPEGEGKTYSRYIAYSDKPGLIYWREADPDEANQGGRPKQSNENDLLAVLPAEGRTTTEWQEKAEEEEGISRAAFFRLKKVLVSQERVIQSKINDKWQPVKKHV